MKPTNVRAFLGGLIGCFAASLVMQYLVPMVGGMSIDAAALLGGLFGSRTAGMMVHVLLGVVVFPLLYVLVFYHLIGGTPFVRGLVYGVALWLLAVVVVMPIAGAGVLMSNVGGMMAVIASLVAHLLYGGILGAVAGHGPMRKT